MSDRYHKGVEILQRIGLTGSQAISSRVAEIAPDFARMAIEFPYADLYGRNGLDLRTREIAAVAALAALGASATHLRGHVESALHLGWSRQELIEILMQTAFHAGFPAALCALTACHDLLADGGVSCASCQSDDPGGGQL